MLTSLALQLFFGTPHNGTMWQRSRLRKLAPHQNETRYNVNGNHMQICQFRDTESAYSCALDEITRAADKRQGRQVCDTDEGNNLAAEQQQSGGKSFVGLMGPGGFEWQRYVLVVLSSQHLFRQRPCQLGYCHGRRGIGTAVPGGSCRGTIRMLTTASAQAEAAFRMHFALCQSGIVPSAPEAQDGSRAEELSNFETP